MQQESCLHKETAEEQRLPRAHMPQEKDEGGPSEDLESGSVHWQGYAAGRQAAAALKAQSEQRKAETKKAALQAEAAKRPEEQRILRQQSANMRREEAERVKERRAESARHREDVQRRRAKEGWPARKFLPEHLMATACGGEEKQAVAAVEKGAAREDKRRSEEGKGDKEKAGEEKRGRGRRRRLPGRPLPKRTRR